MDHNLKISNGWLFKVRKWIPYKKNQVNLNKYSSLKKINKTRIPKAAKQSYHNM